MKVLKNYFYTSFYQIFTIIIPLVTTPYIARTVGVRGMGVAAATLSVSQFFMSISKLGIIKYGAREIASSENEESIKENFISVFISHSCLGVIIFLLYCSLAIIGFFGSNKVILLIQGIYILASIFDVSWFFHGIQNFKVTATRGILIKLSSLILIFMFVKNETDLFSYVLILAVTNFMGSLSLWTIIPKYFDLGSIKITKYISFKMIRNTLIASFFIFIPLWGAQLNTILDVIVLKFFTNNVQVGYYVNAVKIVTIPMYLITSLTLVMFPKISSDLKKNDKVSVLPSIKKTMTFMIYLAAPLSIGLMVISENLVQWFLGKDFFPSGMMISILALKIILVSLNETIGILYLIPTKENRKYSNAVLIGMTFGIMLNSILSNVVGGIGTSISYVLVEFVTFFVLVLSTQEIIRAIPFLEIIKDVFCAILMGGIIIMITYNTEIVGVALTLIQIFVGIISYITMTIIFKSSISRKILQYVSIKLKNYK
ncbi:oligosaccharide flippase family protein [Enterococcus viikkiensis]|uniref:oligosaccharide flippase family protein n=1 Tax=Enterococcus viikkiensis TaxID=930854 RepID=UPI0014774245|nr:oligosaccharide flippase family protein [Enterococcus viikkiensis]